MMNLRRTSLLKYIQYLWLFGLGCSLSFAGFAQSTQATADTLARILAPKAYVNAGLDQMIKEMEEPDVPAALVDSIKGLSNRIYESICDSVAIKIQSKFTLAEQKQLIQFARSPLGTKQLELFVDLNHWLSEFSQKNEKSLSDQIQHWMSLYIKDEFQKGLPYEHQKKKSATEFFKSKIIPAKYYYNELDWKSMNPKDINPVAEFSISHRQSDIICMAIAEPSYLELGRFKRSVLMNLNKVAQEMEVVNEELRKVNNKEMLYLLVSSKVNGMDLMYAWYLYSDEKGSLQYMAFTDKNTYHQHRNVVEEGLNGVVIQSK